MRQVHQDTPLLRLLLLTSCWLIIQLLLLPLSMHQNDLVLIYSSIGLLALIVGMTGYDSWRVWHHTKATCYLWIDALTLIAAVWLLLF